VWTGLRWLSRRPAPPGVRPAAARSDRPAHGWKPVAPSLAERLTERADTAVLQMTDAAARGITRRQLLARTGAVGLALGMGAGTFLFRTEKASAHGYACDSDGSACGPSPLCASTYCNTGRAQACAYERADTARRAWGGGACLVTNSNCWTEHCCAQAFNGHASCCDCCAPTGTINCTSCPQHMHKCICRRRLDTC
jgi:hypothetical protein